MMIWFVVALGVIIVSGQLNCIGTTQMTGYVIKQEQTQYPWKTTGVTYTIVHPTSVVDVYYYYHTYDGWYDFELGKQYKITMYRELFQFYPEITEMVVIE